MGGRYLTYNRTLIAADQLVLQQELEKGYREVKAKVESFLSEGAQIDDTVRINFTQQAVDKALGLPTPR